MPDAVAWGREWEREIHLVDRDGSVRSAGELNPRNLPQIPMGTPPPCGRNIGRVQSGGPAPAPASRDGVVTIRRHPLGDLPPWQGDWARSGSSRAGDGSIVTPDVDHAIAWAAERAPEIYVEADGVRRRVTPRR